MIQTRIKSRERSNESSSFSNNLVKRQSFRVLRGGGGDPPPSLHPTPYEPRFACSLPPPPKIKSWLRAWEGCNLSHASTTFVALIHCRKYFGTYHPLPPNHGYKSTPLSIHYVSCLDIFLALHNMINFLLFSSFVTSQISTLGAPLSSPPPPADNPGYANTYHFSSLAALLLPLTQCASG